MARVSSRPTRTRFCIQKGKGKILMAQKWWWKKEILQDLDGDELTPRPYWIMTRLPPRAPPGPGDALMPHPGLGEVPAGAAALPPTLPEFVEPPSWQAPIPAMETLVSAPRIPPQLDFLDCIHLSWWALLERGKKTQQLDRGCSPPRNTGKETPLQMALRELEQPPVQDVWGTTISPCSLLLPAIFLYGYIKLAETRSTILGGAKGHDEANGDYFSNLPPYVGWHNPTTSLPFQHWGKTQDPNWGQKMAPEGTANPQWWEKQPPPMRGQTGTVTQRKGGATWRDICWIFYKV